jgi:hypothetical protein
MSALHYLPVVGIVVSSISLGVSALAFRYARMKHLSTYPYVEVRHDNSTGKHFVYWTLHGTDAGDWFVAEVTKGSFYHTVPSAVLDGAGIYYVDTTAGAVNRLLRPTSPFIVERHDKPLATRFHLRSKANGAMRVTRIVDVPTFP